MEPLFLSWSALRVHEECRQREYLRRTKHTPKAQDIRLYVHGNIVDRCVRALLEASPGEQVEGRLHEYLPEMFERLTTTKAQGGEADGVVRWRDANDREELYEFCAEFLRRVEPWVFDLVLPYDYVPAWKFKEPLGVRYLDGSTRQVFLVGETDILVRRSEDPPVWHGIDLKATSDDQYWRKTMGQLIFYDLAIQSMTGGVPAAEWGLLQPMCDTAYLPIAITDEMRDQMLARVERMAHFRWQRDHQPKTDSAGCVVCEVRRSCCKYGTFQDATGQRRMSLAPSVQ